MQIVNPFVENDSIGILLELSPIFANNTNEDKRSDKQKSHNQINNPNMNILHILTINCSTFWSIFFSMQFILIFHHRNSENNA